MGPSGAHCMNNRGCSDCCRLPLTPHPSPPPPHPSPPLAHVIRDPWPIAPHPLHMQTVYMLRGVLVPHVCASIVELLRCTVFSTVLSMSNDAIKHVSKEQFVELTSVMEGLLTAFRSGPVRLPAPDAPVATSAAAMAELAASGSPLAEVDSGGSARLHRSLCSVGEGVLVSGVCTGVWVGSCSILCVDMRVGGWVGGWGGL